MVSYILGTAGHIDHGKSALIRTLTGVDPDRLPEEKRRGVTIELGFAQLPLADGTVLGVVDVPGHEKFVRQMVAGSSGVDIALLAVASDDGVMVQTREHIRVLQLMGVTHLVVALTKCDLVDEEWRNLVKLDILDLLHSHGFEDVPIVETSVVTGQGLDALLATLTAQVATIERTGTSEIMRLPVDRVFTIEGAGCVVTGTLWSGIAKVGDTVEILPERREARIRAIQIHGVESSRAIAGQRVALNLSGVATSQIARGATIATPRTIVMTRRFDAMLTYLGSDEASASEASDVLKTGARVHVHHAATTTLGRVVLFDEQTQAVGTETFAQIRLESPISAHYGDRFIIRSYSPAYTIGGGVILMPEARKRATLSVPERAVLIALRDGDIASAVTGVMEASEQPHTSAELAFRLGVSRAQIAQVLNSSDYDRIKVGAQTFYITQAGSASIRDAIEQTLLAFHESHPDQIDMSIATLREQAAPHLDAGLFDEFFAHLVADKRITGSAGRARHTHAPQAARIEAEQLADKALPLLCSQGLAPDSLSDLAGVLATDAKTLARALAPLVEQGLLVRLAGDLYFAPQAIEEGARRISAFLSEDECAQSGATAAQLRDVLGVSRKYAIPLLEYYDRTAVTQRNGDVRRLR